MKHPIIKFKIKNYGDITAELYPEKSSSHWYQREE